MDIKRICIDPGHGGDDAGGSSKGITEAALNLKVAILIRDKLALMSNKDVTFEVFFTRSTATENPTLRDRAMHAHYNKCDMFVSVHHNANQGRSSGYEVIPAYADSAEALADIYAHEFSKYQKICRGIWQKPSEKRPGEEWYTVIDVAEDYNIPAIITEYAYLDNRDDFDYATSDTGVQEQVAAHCAALYKYLLGVDYNPANIIKPANSTNWKAEEVKRVVESGILKDPIWIERYEDNVPVWMLAAVVNRILGGK